METLLKGTGSLHPSTSEKMLIGTMKMFLLLEIFHCLLKCYNL